MLAFLFSFMGGPQGQGGNPLAMWLPIILIFVIMYLLILRPQAKRQKEHQKMLQSLQKGDEVLTAGGIYGTIVGMKEKDSILIIEVDKNVKLNIARTSIARKIIQEEKKGS
ncbi:MAG: preprotein translocase subunit YajC [candidate division KSB1 bacterium]|nr:preprotein translocase subunit YajC [candidate division KSB1 bacterium]MDZ7303503.1 preprotein translocase subunit YajC [candidate division KSB1 bacterium]MDZ7312695.1 preprotein translocase subunit YajC [candidate division KSB1 bacterium]